MKSANNSRFCICNECTIISYFPLSKVSSFSETVGLNTAVFFNMVPLFCYFVKSLSAMTIPCKVISFYVTLSLVKCCLKYIVLVKYSSLS